MELGRFGFYPYLLALAGKATRTRLDNGFLLPDLDMGIKLA